VDLLLQSSGEGVTEKLATLGENDAFTRIEHVARGGRPGSLRELPSVGKGLLDDQTLEIRLRRVGGATSCPAPFLERPSSIYQLPCS
jgi:hypothetical protein